MISLPRPIRILHIVGAMNVGGAETWLMHVLRKNNPQRFQMDFLVHTEASCAFDDEIRALGYRIIPCLNLSRPWTYARNFRRILKEYGPYEIVHSHVHHFSGFVLKLARSAGVPVRIAHSHIDTSPVDRRSNWRRRGYLELSKHWIKRHATTRLACCSDAAMSLFGDNWKNDSRTQLLYCGIDLEPYTKAVDSAAVRAELGIPADAFVIGHVGRFMEQKNHDFIIEVAAEVVRKIPEARLLLLGSGPLQAAIKEKAERLGIERNTIFAGIRRDVVRLLSTMDAFLFPSLWEGMPLSIVEAQAAGIPCFVSDVISTESYAVKPLLTPLSLSCSASVWAERILAVPGTQHPISRSQALSLIQQSSFNIEKSIHDLQAVYVGH